jgi:uncharacterized protein YjiS (DUF1127 family)
MRPAQLAEGVSIWITRRATMSSSTIETLVAQRAELNCDSWPTALTRPIKQGIAWIGSRRRMRRHVEELRTLDDCTLRDIGLSRGDIGYAMWRDTAFDRRNDRLCL